MLKIKKNRSKFNVSSNKSKRTYNGIIFDSENEMKMYRDWIIPQIKNGDILDCKLQVPYELQPKYEYMDRKVQKIVYKADFVATYKDGSIIVYDYKGMADSVAKLKRKMFWYKYPEIDYRWITYSKIDGGYVDWDIVQANRRKRKKTKE